MATKIILEEVGGYLNSNRFTQILAKIDKFEQMSIDPSTISEMMGIAIEYVEIFGPSGNATIEEMEEILNIVVKKKNNKESYNLRDAFANKILRDLQMRGRELSYEEMEIAKEKAIEILGYRGATKFHGFNGSFKDRIQDQGLDPNQKLNMLEWNAINSLFEKYNIAGIKMQYASDRSIVYYSNTATNSYDYAVKSPEWMTRLCGGDNFIRRDYDASRAEMLRIINECHFTSEDAELLLQAFESCWKTFAAGNKPCVVAVPNNIQHDEFDNDILKLKFLEMDFDKVFSVLYSVKSVMNDLGDTTGTWRNIEDAETILKSRTNKDYLRNKFANNEGSYYKIGTEHAVFIDLPTLHELEKRIEMLKNNSIQTGIEV